MFEQVQLFFEVKNDRIMDMNPSVMAIFFQNKWFTHRIIHYIAVPRHCGQVPPPPEICFYEQLDLKVTGDKYCSSTKTREKKLSPSPLPPKKTHFFWDRN